MARAQRKDRPEPYPPPDNPADDPILAHLAEAATAYRAGRERWDADRLALAAAQAAAKDTADKHEARERRFTVRQKALEQARKQMERQKARADHLATALQEIHRALFTGNLYELVLKACLVITGATRGLYITALGPQDLLRVRAGVAMAGSAGDTLSPFLEALCRQVLAANKTIVCNDAADLEGLPAPTRADEHFHNCLVAPVMLLHDLDGIVIAANKPHGEFDEEDVSALLSVGDQASVAVENHRLQLELQQAYLATVTLLADTLEARDPYTHGHCEMVSRLARRTARRLGLSDREQRVVCYTALLHDIGKIGVSDGVLNKPGPLLAEEWELMRAHVRIGHDLVTKLPALRSIGEAVLHHHERYDGTGYPDGLRQEAIPLAARVVTVVDAYCAMMTKRSYKEAYSEAQARDELQRCTGTQFDPAVVAAFLAVLDTPADPDFDEDDCGVLPGFEFTYPPALAADGLHA